jgi:hypothetical protein
LDFNKTIHKTKLPWLTSHKTKSPITALEQFVPRDITGCIQSSRHTWSIKPSFIWKNLNLMQQPHHYRDRWLTNISNSQLSIDFISDKAVQIMIQQACIEKLIIKKNQTTIYRRRIKNIKQVVNIATWLACNN